MEEINFKHELNKLRGEIEIKSLTESGDCLYNILRSPGYQGIFNKQNKCKTICEGYKIASFVVEYKGVEMKIKVTMPFQFERNGKTNNIIPIVDINEMHIELSSFTEKSMRNLMYEKIPMGGGSTENNIFVYYSIAGLHCEGHPMSLSHIELNNRIVRYFDYLTGVIDNMLDENYDKSVDEAKNPPCCCEDDDWVDDGWVDDVCDEDFGY